MKLPSPVYSGIFLLGAGLILQIAGIRDFQALFAWVQVDPFRKLIVAGGCIAAFPLFQCAWFALLSKHFGEALGNLAFYLVCAGAAYGLAYQITW